MGPKKFQVQKNFVSKKILRPENFGFKIIMGPKNFGSKTNLGQKYVIYVDRSLVKIRFLLAEILHYDKTGINVAGTNVAWSKVPKTVDSFYTWPDQPTSNVWLNSDQ